MKIAAVVVTYKSLKSVQDLIDGIKNQTFSVDQTIVVNNGGEDKTKEWLVQQQDIIMINQENIGGAGGFNVGIKRAYEMGFDWIWCLDHDIEVQKSTLSCLINSKVFKSKRIGFLTSLALFNNSEIAYTNVPLLPFSDEILRSLTFNGAVPILCSSFGSVIISRQAVAETGLPIKDIFIWGDDSEYTIRMLELGFKGFLILESRVIHKSDDNEFDPLIKVQLSNFRAKIGIRNKIYLIKLRNKLLYNSEIRGLLASVNYIVKLLKKRFQHLSLRKYSEVLIILKYFVQGLFYNPRKFLSADLLLRLKKQSKLRYKKENLER